jgi:methyl-accepting chemotaxis protein
MLSRLRSRRKSAAHKNAATVSEETRLRKKEGLAWMMRRGLRRFSITARLWSLVAITVMAIAGMSVGLGTAWTMIERAEQRGTEFSDLSVLNGKLRAATLKMRQLEKEFLLDKQEHARTAFAAEADEARNILARMRDAKAIADAASLIDGAKDGLQRYVAQFDWVYAIQKSLGFDARSGLTGRLRKVAGEVEETLGLDGMDTLAGIVMRMRASERDYMLYGERRFVDAAVLARKEFGSAFTNMDFAPSARRELLKVMDGYIADFRAFADADTKLREAVRTIGLIQSEIQPSIDGLAEYIDEQNAGAHEAFLATERVATKGLLAFVAVVLVLSLATGWLIARSINVPMRKLTGDIARLAQRDLTVEISGTTAGDELGEMSRAVQVFKENLVETERMHAERLEAEQQAAAERKRSAEEKRQAEDEKRAAEDRAKEARHKAMLGLADTFEAQVGRVVTEVSGAATHLQSTAGAMSATAEETSRQATAVAAAAEQASTNVQTVASASEELAASIEEIGRQVVQSTTIAKQAVADARRTNEKVQGLVEAAQRIGEVVSLINDIASQTNLLALNATIEAARAGEAGKGFAVVASEVKSLATQTGKATEEIGGQIAAIQTSTTEAVEAIRGIDATITEISEIATAIASAVEEQGAATREIAGNVQQAASGTREVTDNIAGVTQAASDTGQATDQVLEAATVLVQHGDTLRTEMEKFLQTVRAA